MIQNLWLGAPFACSPPSWLLPVINVCTDITPYLKGLLTQRWRHLYRTSFTNENVSCNDSHMRDCKAEKKKIGGSGRPVNLSVISISFRSPSSYFRGAHGSAALTPYQQALEIRILYVLVINGSISLCFKISVYLCNYLYLLLLHHNVMSIFNFLWVLLDFCSLPEKVTIKVK